MFFILPEVASSLCASCGQTSENNKKFISTHPLLSYALHMETPEMLVTPSTFAPNMIAATERYTPANSNATISVVSRVRAIQRNGLRALANLLGDSRD